MIRGALVALAVAAALSPPAAPAQPENRDYNPVITRAEVATDLSARRARHRRLQRALVRGGDRGGTRIAPFEENVLVEPPEPDSGGIGRVRTISWFKTKWGLWCARIGGLEC